LLYLGRIHPKKGVDDLLKAFRRTRKEMPNVPDLVIAGPGLESKFGKAMWKLAGNDPVYFPGMLEGPAKWGAFQGCEAFVLPSHQENFGIAVVEAMACKRAVLITNKVNIHREV
jgi:glycosyltransferase involved in cell wall biosynthesis